MKTICKKFTALFLVFSVSVLSVNLYAKERRGAKLIVTKTDSQQIRGELITIKPNSLLLLNTEGKDVSVDIADIKVITIVKKSKALLGAGLGLIILGGGPALYIEISARNKGLKGIDLGDERIWALVFGLIGAAAGLLIGGVTGALLGTDKKI